MSIRPLRPVYVKQSPVQPSEKAPLPVAIDEIPDHFRLDLEGKLKPDTTNPVRIHRFGRRT